VKCLTLSLVLALGILLGAFGAHSLNAQQQDRKANVVLQTDMTALQGMEGRVINIEYAPGAVEGKHYHTGDVLFYVLEGSETLDVQGKPSLTVKQGEAAHLSPKEIISAKNASGTASLKIVVFAVTPKGQPVSVPVQ
jgi:quercetin dioxygenase-like cupin family protein